MQEEKKAMNLKQFHKATNRHVLVLEADMPEQDKYKMLHLSNVIRIAGNNLTAVMKKNYGQLMRTKKYRALRTAYAKSDGTEQMVHKYKRRKRHGKSIKNRCPGYFQAQVRAKFERTGGIYIEVPVNYRASQYDHTCNKYIKRKLSQRMFLISDGTRVQRDWYSSFLLYCIGRSMQSISRYKCKKCFDNLYDKYLKLEDYIKANKIAVMNSGINVGW